MPLWNPPALTRYPTAAGMPTSGLNPGQLAWAADTSVFYIAFNTTTWYPIAVFTPGPSLPFAFNVPGITLTAGSGWMLNLYQQSPLAQLFLFRDTLTAGSHFQDYPNISGRISIVGKGADPPAADAMGLVNATGKTAAIASANLTNTTPAGLYEITYYLRCTTADVTAGTIQFNAMYTDSVGATTDNSAVVALTSTVNRAQGVIVADLASGNIAYSTTLVGIAGTSQYKLRVRCKFLG